MSDYCKMKVLRIPFEDANIGILKDYDDVDYDLYKKFGDMFYWDGPHTGKFECAPTRRPFIDYILEYEYGADCGEFGKVRELTDPEKLKYMRVFQHLNPSIDMDRVKLVEFCWYNL